MVQMLPESCDPGYAELGIQAGVSNLRQQSELFGINSLPPIDLPAVGHQPTGGVVKSTLATLPDRSQALQGYASIGQDVIADTALQNAMVAAGVANGGVIMTPHLMSSIRDSTGALVKTYAPTPMPRSESPAAAQAVTALMESVPINGTASGVGFPSYLCAAVKTGTAQTGLSTNHDWMIGFAPANNPQIAVAVVVPFQNISSDGAGIAGPIVNQIMQAALPANSVQQPCNVQMPPSSAFSH
jgi:peptidoglycan glycosyltransferase